LLESQSVSNIIIQGLSFIFEKFIIFFIHNNMASHIAVQTKFIVGGKSESLKSSNLETKLSVSSLKGDRTNGIPENITTETLYQERFFTKPIIEFLAESNLEGLISSALIERDTSNNI
jgi:hypothetical protein